MTVTINGPGRGNLKYLEFFDLARMVLPRELGEGNPLGMQSSKHRRTGDAALRAKHNDRGKLDERRKRIRIDRGWPLPGQPVPGDETSQERGGQHYPEPERTIHELTQMA